MTAVLVIFTIILFITIDIVKVRMAHRKEVGELLPVRAFSDIRLPQGLFLGGQHSWARLTSLGELKIGMDELLTQAIGSVDRVELPEVGGKVVKGETLATVFHGGRQLKIASPIDGTVVVANHGLEQDPAAIAEDPYGSGWLATVWPTEHGEALKSLRVGGKAVNWMRQETQRFCDFLSVEAAPTAVGAALADGAHPVVGAALSLDDKGWAEFQKEFLN
ncbi:MAG: glycine cleavage system protein H [Thermoanaerobaculales bacterium]|nr:glycine cleavage system protein H [Thermoanaerobaculales bacterium]